MDEAEVIVIATNVLQDFMEYLQETGYVIANKEGETAEPNQIFANFLEWKVNNG